MKLNKSWKADLEFEALYESAYKQKVDSRNLHPLQRKGIKSAIKSKKSFLDFKNKGIENSKNRSKITSSLYLGKTDGGKKVFFHTEFSREGIKCWSTLDLLNIGNLIVMDKFDTTGGRARNFKGQMPTRRIGVSNISIITIAYLNAFQHICDYKKVGHNNGSPSKELTRELMYLVMPEMESRNVDSPYYGIGWDSVISAWELETDEDYHRYKSYFNSLVEETIKEIKASSDRQTTASIVKAS